MKFKARFYVFLSTYTFSILGLFLTGFLGFLILPFIALIYVLTGGPKRV